MKEGRENRVCLVWKRTQMIMVVVAVGVARSKRECVCLFWSVWGLLKVGARRKKRKRTVRRGKGYPPSHSRCEGGHRRVCA